MPETIKHIAAQKVPPTIPWEVVIVDNASTDATQTICKQEWEKHNQPTSLIVVEQPLAGLINARQKGVETARYEYLVFCDDDNWLFDNYVALAYQTMAANDTIGVLGGCGIFEPQLPSHAEIADHKDRYVNGRQTWAKADHWVYGAGAVFRKSILLKLDEKGWRPFLTGRSGKKLISGEDVEMCFIHHLFGYQIMANDELLFKHFVPISRQNLKYILRLIYWQAYSYVLLTPYITLINKDKRTIEQIMATMRVTYSRRIIKSTALIVLSYIKFKKPVFELKKNWLTNAGMLYSTLANKKMVIAYNTQLVALL